MNVSSTVSNGNIQINASSMAPPSIDLNALATEYADNKAQSDRITQRNYEIAELLEAHAKFKEGSSTGHLSAGGLKLTFSKKVNEKWSQPALELARKAFGDEWFFKVFKWEYKPQSKKDLDAFLSMGDKSLVQNILAAREVSPARTSVKIEAVQ